MGITAGHTYVHTWEKAYRTPWDSKGLDDTMG